MTSRKMTSPVTTDSVAAAADDDDDGDDEVIMTCYHDISANVLCLLLPLTFLLYNYIVSTHQLSAYFVYYSFLP